MNSTEQPGNEGPKPEVVTELLVFGMRSNACREQACAALESVRGVKSVNVSLYRGIAVVRHVAECNPYALAVALHELGLGAAFPPVQPQSLRYQREESSCPNFLT